MNAKKWFVAAALGAAAVAGQGLLEGHVAHAQDATSGAIQGVVKDGDTGEALAGVTVVVAGPQTSPQTVITDENGFYKVTALLPADGYSVTFYYADIVLERRGITVGLNKTAPVYVELKTSDAGGETIVVQDSAPTIDPTSTTQGITLDADYLSKIPVPGRTFEDALGAAAGSQGDDLGVAFSGSTSLENQYYVDGVNTTGLTYGTAGSAVINNFIEEIEVITGGYDAEYGRATGGVVNVVTKTGTNDFAGSAWANFVPGQLRADVKRAPMQASSIDVTGNLDYSTDFGFEVGGPIVKDRAWYWFGFAPQYGSVTYTRATKRRTDCRIKDPTTGQLSVPIGSPCTHDDVTMYQDGKFDTDPDTGFYIYEDLDQSYPSASSYAYSFLGKLNFAATPEHQGQISLQVTPYGQTGNRLYGIVQDQAYDEKWLTTDLSTKWTSKFNDNKTEVEGVIGVHRDQFQFESPDAMRNTIPLQYLVFGNLGTWSNLDNGTAESAKTKQGCADNTGGDPYTLIVNCPDDGAGYAIDGIGSQADDSEQRVSGKVSAIERVKALGSHEIKGGVDAEDNRINKPRVYSGDAFLENYLDRGQVYAYRWVKLGPEDSTDMDLYPNHCRDRTLRQDFPCDFLDSGSPYSQVHGETINWSAYLQDSWQIKPNLTINYGVRYEEQRLRYSRELQHTHDPLTDRDLGTNAMTLQNLWSPRIGALYDWTKEGRSKLYAHWGRFYESIPLDINDRSLGGETQYLAVYDAGTQCGAANDPGIGGADAIHCLDDPNQVPGVDEILYGSGVLVAPGIKPQYMDEIVAGMEYEIMEDLTLGVSYQNRKLGRIIEDISTDGAQTYIIANPGEWSNDEEQKLEDQIAHTDDPNELARLNNELAQYRGIRIFDKPHRDYNALQFTVKRRFSKTLYIQGSYTYSRTTVTTRACTRRTTARSTRTSRPSTT